MKKKDVEDLIVDDQLRAYDFLNDRDVSPITVGSLWNNSLFKPTEFEGPASSVKKFDKSQIKILEEQMRKAGKL